MGGALNQPDRRKMEDDLKQLRRVLEAGLKETGKLPEPLEYKPSKRTIFGEPFSPETMAELAKLPDLTADLNDMRLINAALDDPRLEKPARQYAKLRDELKQQGKT